MSCDFVSIRVSRGSGRRFHILLIHFALRWPLESTVVVRKHMGSGLSRARHEIKKTCLSVQTWLYGIDFESKAWDTTRDHFVLYLWDDISNNPSFIPFFWGYNIRNVSWPNFYLFILIIIFILFIIYWK